MLSRLFIKNVALIDSAELEFGDGLNILSGETGSGKSVILDSVNFVLGAKADKSMIRYGEEECLVRAEFEVGEDSPALEELKNLDIEAETTIIISRKFSLDGRGSIRINGNTVTLNMLKNVTSALVDVHGQSEHFFLLKESNQLKVLDGLCGKALAAGKNKLSGLLNSLADVKKQLSVFSGDERKRNKRIDILKFQIDEIENAALKEGEEEGLRAKREKIINGEKIALALSSASEAFSMDGGATDCIKNALRELKAISTFAAEYDALAERTELILSEAEDIEATLADMRDDAYFDEREADSIEERLEQIKTLKGKYGNGVVEINAYLAEAKKEYDMLINCGEECERLGKEKSQLLKEIYSVCLNMRKIRRAAAEEFSSGVVEELVSLNIPKAAFDVQFNSFAEADAERAGINGLDEICFMFSANKGEPLKPLGKIISGGEMSRFMLSVKTRLKGINGISTYIFDEIDTGISGKTAKVVAEKIAAIAKDTQVIAVSHLAQMVAMSDEHFLIEKNEEGEKTYTHIKKLDGKGKLEEIVRLLGGGSSDAAIKHAEEMLAEARIYKESL